MGTRSFPGV